MWQLYRTYHVCVEEESQGSCSGGEMMERNRKPNEDQSGASVFTTLGTLVLTARPYESASRSTKAHTNTNSSERSAVDTNGASLKGEIFQIVNKDVSDVIVTHIYMYGLQTSPTFNISLLSIFTYYHSTSTCTYTHPSCISWQATCTVHVHVHVHVGPGIQYQHRRALN